MNGRLISKFEYLGGPHVIKTIFACAAVLSLAAGAASAATFSDRAAFNAATTGVTNHATPAFGFTSSATFGGMTFTPGLGAGAFTAGSGWSSLMANEIAIDAAESLVINFAAPVFGFGLDIHEPSTTGASPDVCLGPGHSCTDTTFKIEVFSASGSEGVTNFQPADDVLAFFGVTFAGGITRIEITDLQQTNDNEFFGNFTTASALVPAPVPAAGLLLGGVAALGALRRRA